MNANAVSTVIGDDVANNARNVAVVESDFVTVGESGNEDPVTRVA